MNLPPDDQPPTAAGPSPWSDMPATVCRNCGATFDHAIDTIDHISTEHNDSQPEHYRAQLFSAAPGLGLSGYGTVTIIDLAWLLAFDTCDCPDGPHGGEQSVHIVMAAEVARALGQMLVTMTEPDQLADIARRLTEKELPPDAH
jgi:hypothetical protein